MKPILGNECPGPLGGPLSAVLKDVIMTVMSARDAKNHFGEFIDTARREPVVVTRNNRPVGIMISREDACSPTHGRGNPQLPVPGLSVAISVISGTLARAFDKGQSRLAVAAIS